MFHEEMLLDKLSLILGSVKYLKSSTHMRKRSIVTLVVTNHTYCSHVLCGFRRVLDYASIFNGKYFK